MAKTSCIRRDDNDIRFVLEQHTYVFYRASSVKHRNVVSLGHIILIPSQPDFLFLLNDACLAEKQQIQIV